MSKTETIQTAYGETSIEVVECDSCGTEIDKDSAREFLTGDSVTDFGGKVKVYGSTQHGYICDYCDDAGPMSYPGSDYVSRAKATLPKMDMLDVGMAMIVIGLVGCVLLISLGFAIEILTAAL